MSRAAWVAAHVAVAVAYVAACLAAAVLVLEVLS